MRSGKGIKLRWAIGLVFLLLIFFPVLFISSSLRVMINESADRQFVVAGQQLQNELQDFKTDLIPRSWLQKVIKQAEEKIGLIAATREKPRFITGEDPRLFTSSSIPQLMDAYQQIGEIEPMLLVTFNGDVKNIWSYYNQDLQHLDSSEKEHLNTVLALTCADIAAFEPLKPGDQLTIDRWNKRFSCVKNLAGGVDKAYQNVFSRHISGMTFTPSMHEAVYETATNRYGCSKVFCYYRVFKEGERLFGGYFVMFGSKQMPVEKLLRYAGRNSGERFSRAYLSQSTPFAGEIIHQSGGLLIKAPLPGELIGYNNLFEQPSRLPGMICALYSSAMIENLYGQQNHYLGLITRTIIAFCLFAGIYFGLFGFPDYFRLRLKMLLSISFIVLLPYTLLGFFSIRLLQQIDRLTAYDLKSEAETVMFRLENYYSDQRLQNTLRTMQVKDNLMQVVDLPENELNELHSHQVVRPGSMVDMHLVRNDGFARSFRSRNPGSKGVSNIDITMSTKYLENLGVLQREKTAVKKLLNIVSLVDGMLETLRYDYLEHAIMINEGFETREIKKIDDFSRMIYYLVPSLKQPDKPVGMAITGVSNPNYVIYQPYNFDQRIYSAPSSFASHHFAMGQRRHDDFLLRWWPGSLSPDSSIKKLLDDSAMQHSSGSRLTVADDGTADFASWRCLNNESMTLAGESTAPPDQLIGLLIRVFPFLLMVFAIVSVFLFADILAALFIAPVRGFRLGAEAVSAGDFSASIRIARSDEFALLADSFNRMAAGLAQREKMRRFVSEDLFEKLGQNQGFSEIKTARVSQVTLLASDIRGFTTISEKQDPQIIVSLLNDYFTEMEAAITSCGGMIERFVGDAVMAVFYADGRGSSEAKAVAAAVKMRQSLLLLNQKRSAAGLFVIDNGIGVATGPAASGTAGSETGRMVFAVIGEVATLAEKLESSSRHVESRILLCEKTASRVDGDYRLVSALPSTKINCFAVSKLEVN